MQFESGLCIWALNSPREGKLDLLYKKPKSFVTRLNFGKTATSIDFSKQGNQVGDTVHAKSFCTSNNQVGIYGCVDVLPTLTHCVFFSCSDILWKVIGPLSFKLSFFVSKIWKYSAPSPQIRPEKSSTLWRTLQGVMVPAPMGEPQELEPAAWSWWRTSFTINSQ